MTPSFPIVSLPTSPAEIPVIGLTDLPIPATAETLLASAGRPRYWRPEPLRAEMQLAATEPEAFGMWLPNVCY